MYTIEEKGAPNSSDYRIYLRDANGPISPLHDIPLYANEEDGFVNMVVSAPRWTNAKTQMCLRERLNPIKQTKAMDKLRFVGNFFPHHGFMWNCGAIPQTWEDPNHIDGETGLPGDGGPLDILEIGHRIANRGEVLHVKVLGALAVIEKGSVDWKILAIDVNDPHVGHLHDVDDVRKFFPGLIKASSDWFKTYRIPDRKEVDVAFEGKAKFAALALQVIAGAHTSWGKLINKEVDTGAISCVNVTVQDSPCNIAVEEADKILESVPKFSEPLPREDVIDKWIFAQPPKKY